MTFCIGVASRPPHSLGQLMAAQRPSLQPALPVLAPLLVALDAGAVGAAAGVVVVAPVGEELRAGSRRATPAARRGTRRPRRCRRSPSDRTLTSVSGLSVGCRSVWTSRSQRRPGRAPRRRCARSSTAEAPSGYVRAMADDERGFTDDDLGQDRRPRLARPARPRGARRPRPRARRHGRRAWRRWGALPFPGPFFSSAVARHARGASRSATPTCSPQLAVGRVAGTVALEELGPRRSRRPACAPAPGARAPTGCSRVRSRSCSTAHTADWVIVVARTRGRARHVPARGAARRAGPDPRPHPQGRPARARRDAGRCRSARPATRPALWRRVVDDAAVAARGRARRRVRRRARDGDRVRQGARAVRPADRHASR